MTPYRGTRLRSADRQAKATGHSFLVVVEGEKTEIGYFQTLRKRLELTAVGFEIVHPEGTDPLTLTKKAIELKKDRALAARRGEGVQYDEVWVVFDLERPHDQRRKLAKDAGNLSKHHGILCAASDPCFEYWLLLHYEYTTAMFGACHEVIQCMKQRHGRDYIKSDSGHDDYIERLATAVSNAQRCRDFHDRSGGDCSPMTGVDLLVSNLNRAVPSHRRLF